MPVSATLKRVLYSTYLVSKSVDNQVQVLCCRIIISGTYFVSGLLLEVDTGAD